MIVLFNYLIKVTVCNSNVHATSLHLCLTQDHIYKILSSDHMPKYTRLFNSIDTI